MNHDDSVSVAELLDERRHLLEVTYWMLGNSREAESVVGETYRRWYGLSEVERGEILSSPILAREDRWRDLSGPACSPPTAC